MVHPENIMLAVLEYKNPSVRADAVVLILNVRQYPCPVTTCSFRKRNLIFDAEHYRELIDLRVTQASNLEPPHCMAIRLVHFLLFPKKT